MKSIRALCLSFGICVFASIVYAKPAADINNLTGVWIVQARSSPGVLLSTVTISQGKHGLAGVWKSADVLDNAYLEDIRLEQTSLWLTLTDGTEKMPLQGTFDGPNRLTLTPSKDSGSVWEGLVLMRASQADIAKLRSALPHGLITRKIELPPLRDLAGNRLALTPPMGWNSWNHFHESIDDKAVREVADAIVASGLREAGYIYVNIDDAWQGRRDPNGVLHPNSKFPDMKALADYVHERGLKLGIYNSPGPLSCAGYVGSHGYETQDADTFAGWGIDYLKYDWCSAQALYKTQQEMQALYQKMGEALQATGRPIVYSLCQYGKFDVTKWGRRVGGNLWRTTDDIGDTWASISGIGFGEIGKGAGAGPGGWNDPDMLEIGNGGMTLEEYRTHFSLWAMLSAPLILGNDVRHMTPEIRSLLTNKDVIAIDQDALGNPPQRVRQSGTTEVWTKPLADGATAIALFNRGDNPVQVDVKWTELNVSLPLSIKDLWGQLDVPAKGDGYRAIVPSHGTVLLRIAKANPTVNQAPSMAATASPRRHLSDPVVSQSNQSRSGHTT